MAIAPERAGHPSPCSVEGSSADCVFGVSLSAVVQELQLTELLGTGAGGQVWSGLWRGSKVAVKLMLSATSDQLHVRTQEALLSRIFAHPSLVQCFAINTTELRPPDLDPETYQRSRPASSRFHDSLLASCLDLNAGVDLLPHEAYQDVVARGAPDQCLAGQHPWLQQSPSSGACALAAAAAAGVQQARATPVGAAPRLDTTHVIRHLSFSAAATGQEEDLEAEGRPASCAAGNSLLPSEGAPPPGRAQCGGGAVPSADAGAAVIVSTTLLGHAWRPLARDAAACPQLCAASAGKAQLPSAPPLLMARPASVDAAASALQAAPAGVAWHPAGLCGTSAAATAADVAISPTGTHMPHPQQPLPPSVQPPTPAAARSPAMARSVSLRLPSRTAVPAPPALAQGAQVRCGPGQPVSPTELLSLQFTNGSLDALNGSPSKRPALLDVLCRLGAAPGKHLTMVIMEHCDGGTLLQHINHAYGHADHGSRPLRAGASCGSLLGGRPKAQPPGQRQQQGRATAGGGTAPPAGQKEGLRSDWVLRNALEVAQAMEYLHSLDMVHGDLKPGNVLLKTTHASRRGYCCKLSDFGLSCPLTASNPQLDLGSSRWGALPYLAPEVPQGKSGKPSDVYSFGALLWHMATGRMPHAGLTPHQILVGQALGELELGPWPADMDPTLRKIGQACLQRDPQRRPTFEAIAKALAIAARAACSRQRSGPARLTALVDANAAALTADAIGMEARVAQ